MMNHSTDARGLQWLAALARQHKLGEPSFSQRSYSWWEAWRLGEREALIQSVEASLGRAVAAQEVDALPQVRAWEPRHKPRLVWTGFEPFDVHASNPSGPIAMLAAERSTSLRWDSSAQILPVTYDQALRFAQELDDDPERPLFLIHLGLAAARAEVCFEVFAHNVSGAKPDNDGECGLSSRLLDGQGPLARRTSLPVIRMCELWAHMAPPLAARASHDAGDYICNAILYHSLGHLERRAGPGAAIFIHLPALAPTTHASVAKTLAELITGLMLGVLD